MPARPKVPHDDSEAERNTALLLTVRDRITQALGADPEMKTGHGKNIQFADCFNLSRSTATRILEGETLAPLLTLIDIAEKYHLSLDWLAGRGQLDIYEAKKKHKVDLRKSHVKVAIFGQREFIYIPWSSFFEGCDTPANPVAIPLSKAPAESASGPIVDFAVADTGLRFVGEGMMVIARGADRAKGLLSRVSYLVDTDRYVFTPAGGLPEQIEGSRVGFARDGINASGIDALIFGPYIGRMLLGPNGLI